MKKVFLFLFLILRFAGVFAETGYNGHQWYCKKNEFPEFGREGPENMLYNYEKIVCFRNYRFYWC